MNIPTVMAPMMASVVAAFLDWGRRNAWTPSAIASTPVRAVEPDEKALRMRNRVKECSGSRGSPALGALGQPSRQEASPARSVT
jgi:hypothetical protein